MLLLASIARHADFRAVVDDLAGMLVAPEVQTTYARPMAKRGVSEWFGQMAADRLMARTMDIAPDKQMIADHIDFACGRTHPMANVGSMLPDDVRAAADWVCAHRHRVAALRDERLDKLEALASRLSAFEAEVTALAPKHVKDMIGYTPKPVWQMATGMVLGLPDVTLPVDCVMGMPVCGQHTDTGMFRPKHDKACGATIETLQREDPGWNTGLLEKITQEGRAPANKAKVLASWHATMEEVRVGWCSEVVGGLRELEVRFAGQCRVQRRFAVPKGNGGARNCDDARRSGHNAATILPETIAPIGADYPLELAAYFAKKLGIDESWSPLIASNDVIAAYRRLACGDPSAMVVAQWDPIGERVALFYVHGFTFGHKAAVVGWYRHAERLTRAAVRLGPVACGGYFDDWVVCEPSFAGDSGQRALKRMARLFGIGLDGVEPRTGPPLPAKEQKPSLVGVFLGVVFDFRSWLAPVPGTVRVGLAEARISKVRAQIADAIAAKELPDGDARKLCGRLQYSLAWCVGAFGRAALAPLYRIQSRYRTVVWSAVEGALRFFQEAFRSLRAREVCVAATGRAPPIIIWSDAMFDQTKGVGAIAFVARFPAGVASPADASVVPSEHPSWVHASAEPSEELMGSLDVRGQQIGQLELAAAVAAYYTLGAALSGRDVFHYVDNSAAVFGLAKGYSKELDSAGSIHALYALNMKLSSSISFEWVQSEANIADLPSRGEFGMLRDLGSKPMRLREPPMGAWLQPAQAEAAAAGAEMPTGPAKRGGRRGKSG